MKFAITMFVIWFSFGIVGANAARIVENQPGIVHYEGEVTKGDALNLLSRLEYGDTLIVTSQGGNSNEGILIARVLEMVGGITVVVKDYCNSSCANFSLAAERKIGTFGFHKSRLPQWIRDSTPEAKWKLAEQLGNAKVYDHIWSKYLTGDQIDAIIAGESRTQMVYFTWK